MLFQKCSIQLLNIFTKIYQIRHIYPSIIKSSSDGINTYKLPSLDYEVTDHHLSRGFVTSRKPNTTILCDYLYCEYTNYLIDGIILACGHGYYNHCLQKCQFKCLICLGYLQNKVKKNVDALMTSLTKKSGKQESVEEDNKNTDEDDLNDIDEMMDNIVAVENLLEHAKESFLKL